MAAVLRRLHTVSTALSLLLCVVAVVLWMRSWSREEGVGWIGRHPAGVVERPERWVGVVWGQGAVCVFFERPGVGWRVGRGPFTAHSRLSTRPDFLPSPPSWHGMLDLGAWRVQQRTTDGSVISIDYWYAPLWLVAAATTVLPALRARRRLRERSRRRSGLCAVCGYDLRATPGRCPECGAVPS